MARTSGSDALVGWRGRILLLPLLAAAPALVLGVMAALPTTTGLVRRGGWGLAFGVVVSFLAVWIVLSPVVVWVYRVVGPQPARLALDVAGRLVHGRQPVRLPARVRAVRGAAH